MKQIIVFSGLMFLCIYLVFTNTPASQKTANIESIETDASVQNNPETSEDVLEFIVPELEYIHEEDQDEEVDGYIVETYREYEVYKDKDGNILKQVPTSNFDYIRYKKY
ncbi:hypothetical protein M3204_15400 [Mesobacillus subterraneus]|uniref:hypothetical protein n=1 Tax=Mesobacillus subterraneus TaxID=285983 RepID=UPI00203A98B7|nr:hypothetical protein [Mesobacillus subterraneus]MCM3665804.1 hypothetical protein [Mesobacillus subterraneus]MCM3684804.1 hypothetical protein [Mesobacillus subterraneus]